MLRCAVSQTALPPLSAAALEGLKPPWNQPQVTLRLLSRSPMFLPDIVMPPALAQSSLNGCGSPIIVLFSTEPAMFGMSEPCVWPEIRLIAPTVDGPKLVPNELSLIEKFCA